MLAKLLALGTKLFPSARWFLGLSALIWFAASFYESWIGQYGTAAILLAWATAHGVSWIFFDRWRVFALVFGMLASGLYAQVFKIKVDSWAHNPPLYLRVIEHGSEALCLVFILAFIAQVVPLAQQRRPKKGRLKWKLWETNFPEWLVPRGFVQSEKWRVLSFNLGGFFAMTWVLLRSSVSYDFRAAPNTPVLTIAIALMLYFFLTVLLLPLFFAVPWGTVQLIGWVVQRLSQRRSPT